MKAIHITSLPVEMLLINLVYISQTIYLRREQLGIEVPNKTKKSIKQTKKPSATRTKKYSTLKQENKEQDKFISQRCITNTYK